MSESPRTVKSVLNNSINARGCGFNFVERDKRSNPLTAIKRAFAIILYSLGKASLGFIAKLFNVPSAAVLKWIRKEEKTIEEPEIACHLEGIEFDKMWHFVQSKKQKMGYQSLGSIFQKNHCLGCWQS